MSIKLTQEFVHECFDYDTANGLLTWKELSDAHFRGYNAGHERAVFNFNNVGKSAILAENARDGSTVYRVRIPGVSGAFNPAKIIWLWLHGYYVGEQIVKGANFHLSNLKPAGYTRKKFIRNKAKKAARKKVALSERKPTRGPTKKPIVDIYDSGNKFVRKDAKTDKWLARIKYQGELKFLGLFDNMNDALAAYDNAAEWIKNYGKEW
ncbi:HNH homing endonuclease [Hafnia phage yong3]|nr:HNH homing endonuclease [Hafnia phage yong3]